MRHLLLAAAIFIAPGIAGAADYDVDAGEKVFNKCRSCHMVGERAKSRVGPVLNGVVGRPWGAVEGFRYSDGREGTLMEMAKDGRVWDVSTLDAYLTDVKGTIPRGRMAFPGLRSEEDRMNVIAYLASFDADGNKVDPAPVLAEHGAE